MFEARDLISEPANILHTEEFVSRIKKLESPELEIEVLDEKEMQDLGMNALLGVGQGSSKKTFLVIMNWKGGKKNEKPIIYLGKGVCFDSGGISIKPSALTKPVIEPEPLPVGYAIYPFELRTKCTRLNSVFPFPEFNLIGRLA